jgi:hypothetical protein
VTGGRGTATGKQALALSGHVCGGQALDDEERACSPQFNSLFLELNGMSLTHGSEELYELTMAVAAGRMTKTEVMAALMRIGGVDASRG